jgi:acyl-CoA dehydrogenase
MEEELFALPTKYLNLQSEAKKFAASVRNIAAAADESASIDPEMRVKLAESGLARVMVSSKFGGRFEDVDSLAVTVIREQLAAESGHLDSLFAMQGIGSYAISKGGSSRVQEEWLEKVGALDAIAALALTEPQVGSDLKAITTTIEERPDGLVVRGHKSFITNAGDADFYCVLGREGDEYSLVFVPSKTDGVSTSRPHELIAQHVIGDVVFDDVLVPSDSRLGEKGAGFKLVFATLATFRVSVAGSAVGLATAALEEAVRHAASREQFGVPLARLGGVPAALALSWTEIEMARSLTYRAAAAAARDPMNNLDLSSLAKVGATEVAGRVVDRAVQVMGRFGLVRGSKIERLYREARPMRIYEGATETIYDSLARRLVKETTK